MMHRQTGDKCFRLRNWRGLKGISYSKMQTPRLILNVTLQSQRVWEHFKLAPEQGYDPRTSGLWASKFLQIAKAGFNLCSFPYMFCKTMISVKFFPFTTRTGERYSSAGRTRFYLDGVQISDPSRLLTQVRTRLLELRLSVCTLIRLYQTNGQESGF